MTISMLIENRKTKEFKEIFVCTNAGFHTYWERGAIELGLEMVPALGGLWVTAEYRGKLLAEFDKLRIWANRQISIDKNMADMTQRLDSIIKEITSHSDDDFEISFG